MDEDEKLEARRAANRAYYQKNKAAQSERNRKWREAHPEKMKEYNREWHARHPGYSTARSKRWVAANPEKAKVLMRKWYEDNRAATVAKTRQKNTGCTPEQYDTLLEQQQGLCAICGQPPGKFGLGADHCHTVGHVRGLLCTKCNSILGFANDSIEILEAAITYLKK